MTWIVDGVRSVKQRSLRVDILLDVDGPTSVVVDSGEHVGVSVRRLVVHDDLADVVKKAAKKGEVFEAPIRSAAKDPCPNRRSDGVIPHHLFSNTEILVKTFGRGSNDEVFHRIEAEECYSI